MQMKQTKNFSTKFLQNLSHPQKGKIQKIGGVSETLLSYLIAEKHETGVWLHVAKDEAQIHKLHQLLAWWNPQLQILDLPAWDCLPYDRVSPSSYILSKRAETLALLASREPESPCVVITSVNAWMQMVPAAENFSKRYCKIELGAPLKRDFLINYLSENGYVRVSIANDSGEFAVRGSIIDIFPSGAVEAIRIDCLGDEVESIRRYDPSTQLSLGNLESYRFAPAGELLVDEQNRARFRTNYREKFGAVSSQDSLYAAITEGRRYAGMEHWLPLFYNKLVPLWEYAEIENVSVEEGFFEACEARQAQITDCYDQRISGKNYSKKLSSNYQADIYHPLEYSLLYNNYAQAQNSLLSLPSYVCAQFDSDEKNIINMSEFGFHSAPNFYLNAQAKKQSSLPLLREYLQEDVAGNRDKIIIICCYGEGSLTRMAQLLADENLLTQRLENFAQIDSLQKGIIVLTILPLVGNGFSSAKILLLGEESLFGERMQRKRSNRKQTEHYLLEASSLSEGELVVHREHGVGRFEALETLTISGQRYDCLRVVYEGGDKLYVPVVNMDLITRYGSDDENSALDRLGGSGWQNRKARLKQRIKMAAEALLAVAAARSLVKSTEFIPCTKNYSQFCARFPYPETDDQLRSIAEIEEDLRAGKPMDRLICGDVGFGKTEVALRAAFIVAAAEENPGQVALIAPTTLLARQHAQTFRERFAPFPFNVGHVSRFVSAKEVRDTKAMLENGAMDVVVGTHALLAKNICFKRLGLVIVDEEQLFGVKQKEALKALRSNVHVLSLSATPIPRTMQMALSGVRELSLIATPPVDRLAVRTYVMPFDPIVVREAVLRERARGGRCFFVVPRINDLEEMRVLLKELLPECSIAEAHGRLSAEAIDDVMNGFYDGRFDVLLSTNIVGSGLDVPAANTIIVHRADRFGLAQLYQLRGRVGRGKLRGYAYFTLPPRIPLTTTAEKRLQVMHGIDALGAGFTIASHDMDIRGFGNMLGEEQSGHIREVGMELYQEMLSQAILQLKEVQGNEAQNEPFSPQLNLSISALIPEDYVADLALRMGLYRRISALESKEAVEQFAMEMTDRFGKMPAEFVILLQLMELKQLCVKARVARIDAGQKGLLIYFHQHQFPNPDALIAWISKNPLRYKLRPDQGIFVSEALQNAEQRLRVARHFVEQLVSLLQ